MKILVFIGPSGAGKSTLIRRLRGRGIIELTPSWTTRPPRPDEAGETLDHHFVTEDEFERMTKAGFFFETVEMFGFRYGLPPIGPAAGTAIPAIMVRAPLLDRVAKYYPDHVVYQIESDLDTARERLEARGLSSAEIDARLAGFEDELELGRQRSTRSFDTSDPGLDPVIAIKQAVATDFEGNRSAKQPPLPPLRPMTPVAPMSAWLSTFLIVVGVVAGLGVIAYFALVFLAIAAFGFGSNK